MLKYIELVHGHGHRGPAWIALVTSSRSGRTIYFNGRALHRGRGVIGNHFDPETREEFWISGVKKRGTNRHWAGGGLIKVERSALPELLRITGSTALPRSGFILIEDMRSVAIDYLHARENEPLEVTRQNSQLEFLLGQREKSSKT